MSVAASASTSGDPPAEAVETVAEAVAALETEYAQWEADRRARRAAARDRLRDHAEATMLEDAKAADATLDMRLLANWSAHTSEDVQAFSAVLRDPTTAAARAKLTARWDEISSLLSSWQPPRVPKKAFMYALHLAGCQVADEAVSTLFNELSDVGETSGANHEVELRRLHALLRRGGFSEMVDSLAPTIASVPKRPLRMATRPAPTMGATAAATAGYATRARPPPACAVAPPPWRAAVAGSRMERASGARAKAAAFYQARLDPRLSYACPKAPTIRPARPAPRRMVFAPSNAREADGSTHGHACSAGAAPSPATAPAAASGRPQSAQARALSCAGAQAAAGASTRPLPQLRAQPRPGSAPPAFAACSPLMQAELTQIVF